MELSYRQYTKLMDELVSEGYNVLEASQMIFSGQLTEEQVWEEVENWVNSLVEEGYDLSDYTWEEMYEGYLSEMGQPGGNRPGGNRPAPAKPQLSNIPTTSKKPSTIDDFSGYRTISGKYRQATAYSAYKAGGGDAAMGQGRGTQQDIINQGFKNINRSDGGSRAITPTAKPAAPARPIATSPAASRPAASRPAAGASARPTATATAPKPAAASATAPKPTPAATAAPKPTPAATAAPKPATTPMQQFAAANPKLAAASAERDRTRGTSATTNPLMKKTFGADYVSKMPAPKTPSPTTSSTAFSSSTPALGTSTPAMQSAGTAAASKPTTTGVSGFKMSTDLSKPAETKKNQQKIAAGMEIKGNSLQEELRGDSYGSNARPDSLYDAYQSIYNQ
jgi:hypothetical protein